MRQKNSVAVALLPLLSNAAALHAILVLFAFREQPIADHKGMLIWWGGLFICYAALTLFLRRPRELRSVIVLGSLILLGQLVVTIRFNPVYGSFTGWFACLCMWVYGYYQCAVALLQGVKPETLTVNFETTSVMLFLTAALASAEAMPGGTTAHLALGELCVLMAMMRLRTLHTRIDTSESRPAVALMVPVVLLGAAACAVMFCVAVSGRAAQFLTKVTAWLGLVLKMTADAVGAFFMWLFSLFPEVRDPTEGEGFAPDALPGGTTEMVHEGNGILLYLLIAAVIVALLVLVFKIWRTVQLQSPRARRTVVRGVTVQKSGVWNILRRLVLRVLHRVGFELRYLRSYNTVAGLLVWLERRMARRGIKRKVGETAASYLLRVGARYPEGEGTLAVLAKGLDRYYFGDGNELSKDEIRILRKQLRGLKSQKS